MLAPIMTPMDWVNVKSPAFTKLTTITVVAGDTFEHALGISHIVVTDECTLRSYVCESYRYC